MRIAIRAHVPATITAIGRTLENGFVQCQYFKSNIWFFFAIFGRGLILKEKYRFDLINFVQK